MSETAERRKVVLIGGGGFTGIECVPWTDLEIPNLADYDVVLINGCELVPWLRLAEQDKARTRDKDDWNRLYKRVDRLLERSRDRLRALLISGGAVFAILPPIEYFYFERPDSFPHHGKLDVQAILPVTFEVEEEKGDTVEVRDAQFTRYLKQIRSWYFSFRPPPDEFVDEELAAGVSPQPRVMGAFDAIAVNRQGQPIAARLSYTTAFSGRPTKVGNLVLLPTPTEVSVEDGIRILLEDFCGYEASRPDPPWLARLTAPEEAEAAAEAESAQAALTATQGRLDAAVAKVEGAIGYKRVLSEKGHTLQELVRKTFEAMGVRSEDSPVSDEFVLLDDVGKILVEVTGSDRSIATRDLSQLIKDMGKYVERTGSTVKGVLIVNPWKDLPPDERNTKDRPTFPDDVVKTASPFSIALLSTIELFNAYCALRHGQLTADEVMQRIRDTTGIVILVE